MTKSLAQQLAETRAELTALEDLRARGAAVDTEPTQAKLDSIERYMTEADEPRNPVVRTTALRACPGWQVREYQDGTFDADQVDGLGLSPGCDSFDEAQDWALGESRAAVSCGCESSLCDHDGRCSRPVDGRLLMEYVQHTCTQCAANMAASDGGVYLALAGEADTIPVHDPNDPEAREPAPATDWDDEREAESRFGDEDYRRDVRGFNDDTPYEHGAGGGDPDEGWD